MLRLLTRLFLHHCRSWSNDGGVLFSLFQVLCGIMWLIGKYLRSLWTPHITSQHQESKLLPNVVHSHKQIVLLFHSSNKIGYFGGPLKLSCCFLPSKVKFFAQKGDLDGSLVDRPPAQDMMEWEVLVFHSSGFNHVIKGCRCADTPPDNSESPKCRRDACIPGYIFL